VTSEVYYPAWHAYLDDQPVPLYAADHALRAVALPVGDHVVEMRYESLALNAGLLLTVAAVGLLVSLAILHSAASKISYKSSRNCLRRSAVFAALRGVDRYGDVSGEVRCKSGAVPQL